MSDDKKETTTTKKSSGPKRYYLVNPGGAIHEVTYDLAQSRLKRPGYRMATAAEVKELEKRGGNQTSKDPIAQPWSPDPDAQEE
jgi:hypothetical protein